MALDPSQLRLLDNAVAQADAAAATAGTPLLSDADLATQLGPVTTPRPYYVNHRTMLDACCGVDLVHGTAAAEWVAAAVKAQLPATYTIYVAPGTSDGSGGGLDVSNPATVGFINQLVAASAGDQTFPGLFTQAMADEVIALGKTITYPAGAPVVTADITASRARLANQVALGKSRNALATTLNDWLVQQATAPNKAAVLAQVGAALDQAGVQ